MEKKKLAQAFAKVYEKEWREARNSLKKHKHEEEIVYLLMRIVRAAFDYCVDENSNLTGKDAVKHFLHHSIPKGIHEDHVTSELRTFIRKCMECLLEMCSDKNNMSIAWAPKGDIIDRSMYKVEGSEDQSICDWTVWPAVLDSDGSVLTKGIILPIT